MQAASDQETTGSGGPSAAATSAGQPSPARTAAPGQGSRPPQIPPPQKPRGRGLALLALVAASLALLVAGTLYWRTYYEPNPLTFRVAQIETRLGALDQRVRDSAAEIERATRLRERQGAAVEPTDAGSAPAIGAGLASGTPADAAPMAGAPGGSSATPSTATGVAVPADWQLAEIRYLLRMANHRLQLERDVRGAMLLLRAADNSLQRLDDPRFTPVRAHIAEELLALEALPGADAEGLFLALEAIKSDLGDLKARTPSFEPATRESQPAADGTLANLWAAVSELIRFRRLDTPAEALLLPEEALYLELNLRLMLERAQLAALRREQPIYDSSIAEARAWVARYLDPTDASVRRVSEGLAAVAPMELAAPLPDLSASLVTLDAALGAAP